MFLRKLFTLEDSRYYHAHKIMGMYCLLHYLYRLWCYGMYGSMLLEGGGVGPALSLVPHLLLHVSSFQFHLSSKRNKSYNIIWPEMRWHSMIFAYRSIIALYVMMLVPAYWLPYSRSTIVMLTMVAADYATHYYKEKEMVEKSDSTMRGNPYPAGTPEWFRKSLNMFYSISQVFATSNILVCGMGSIFLVLIPIQTSSFLMTLERKGYISQFGWHAWYTAALLLNYMYAIIHGTEGHAEWFGGVSLYQLTVIGFCLLRFRFNLNKYVLWSVVCGLHMLYPPRASLK